MGEVSWLFWADWGHSDTPGPDFEFSEQIFERQYVLNCKHGVCKDQFKSEQEIQFPVEYFLLQLTVSTFFLPLLRPKYFSDTFFELVVIYVLPTKEKTSFLTANK